jgi:predicted kinase
MMENVVAIILSGPQATGKTTLAMALGEALSIPVFSRDPLMDALLPPRAPRMARRLARRASWVPAAGLRLQTALLARQLELGQSAILECVAPLATRRQWRQMCAAAKCRFVSVECTCSDLAEHRARTEQRRAGGRSGLDWDYVTATIALYQPDADADFVADAVRPLPDLVASILKIAAN